MNLVLANIETVSNNSRKTNHFEIKENGLNDFRFLTENAGIG